MNAASKLKRVGGGVRGLRILRFTVDEGGGVGLALRRHFNARKHLEEEEKRRKKKEEEGERRFVIYITSTVREKK